MITMKGIETTDEHGQKCWFLPDTPRKMRCL